MLDRETGKLAVPATFRKGGGRPMLYVLKRGTLDALATIDRPERELIFPFPHTGFYYHYKRLLRLAELPHVPWKSVLQEMRRSFATYIEAAGGNVTDALAHSERYITERSHLDPRLIERTPANELLFEIAR